MSTYTRRRTATLGERATIAAGTAQTERDVLEGLRRDFTNLCMVANACGLAYVVRTHWMSAFDEPYRAGDTARCRGVFETLRARVEEAKIPPAERERRAQEEWRHAQEAAELAAETARWIARGPRAILEEIERTGERRVFLTGEGAIAVRGRGTDEHLRAALLNHANPVRLILEEREVVEEVVAAPPVTEGRS